MDFKFPFDPSLEATLRKKADALKPVAVKARPVSLRWESVAYLVLDRQFHGGWTPIPLATRLIRKLTRK